GGSSGPAPGRQPAATGGACALLTAARGPVPCSALARPASSAAAASSPTRGRASTVTASAPPAPAPPDGGLRTTPRPAPPPARPHPRQPRRRQLLAAADPGPRAPAAPHRAQVGAQGQRLGQHEPADHGRRRAVLGRVEREQAHRPFPQDPPQADLLPAAAEPA